jgi:hypothetical protein
MLLLNLVWTFSHFALFLIFILDYVLYTGNSLRLQIESELCWINYIDRAQEIIFRSLISVSNATQTVHSVSFILKYS